jgi:hypothetical protein
LIEARVASLVLLLVVGCGGAVVDVSPVPDSGARRDGGRGGQERDRDNEGSPGVDARPQDDFPVFREDACPDAPIPTPPLECDPFMQSTCPLRQGCYPVPPRATDSCHPGTYSTLCLPSGNGAQGWPCGDATDCVAGFICVKSGEGDQCVKLCKPTDIGSCTDGRVCREVDVTGSGWGGCE